MKCVILAGGLGTRIAEETGIRPKPMIEIGGRPILWHIMKIYSSHGIDDFVVCCGYKAYMIKEYFANYFLHMSDVTFHIAENRMEVHRETAEPWRVTLIDTGEATQTGGRLKRVLPHVADQEVFAMTYGDGVCDIDITAEIVFHREHGRDCTLAAVRPPGRFGALSLKGDRVVRFKEKPDDEGAWINGGFFLMSPRVAEHIDDDFTVWEREPLERLARANQLRAFQHHGFWQPMDTMRDKISLETEWAGGAARWKNW